MACNGLWSMAFARQRHIKDYLFLEFIHKLILMAQHRISDTADSITNGCAESTIMNINTVGQIFSHEPLPEGKLYKPSCTVAYEKLTNILIV